MSPLTTALKTPDDCKIQSDLSGDDQPDQRCVNSFCKDLLVTDLHLFQHLFFIETHIYNTL